MNPTHTRIDGLFFGVLLGYLYHFRPDTIRRICRPGSKSNRHRAALGRAPLQLLLFLARRSFSPGVRIDISVSGIWRTSSPLPGSPQRAPGRSGQSYGADWDAVALT